MKYFLLTFLYLLLNNSFAFNINNALINTYEGLKQRNIYSYQIHLVHRPYSEYPDDIVSEGLGYGLLTSLYFNDYETFNEQLITAEKHMWNGQFYNWHLDVNGNIIDFGGATDAEEDIALSLIFGLTKIKKNEWPSEQMNFYKSRAQEILNNLWNVRMISQNGYICPGNNWGCDSFVNPSYFAPAWYKIFSVFDSNKQHNWNLVIDENYNLLKKTIGYNIGLIPDWNDLNGNFVNDYSLGYNAYGNGQYFFKDAIRTLFRIGIDYLWFKDSRAKEYLINAKDFIMSQGGAKSANFFKITPTNNNYNLPIEDTWTFDGGQKTRHRNEHSHMTIAMWSIPIFLVGNETEKKSFYNELGEYYETNKTYWGKTIDPINNEDIQHNEMYFDQFLAIFGALIMDNCFPNLENV